MAAGPNQNAPQFLGVDGRELLVQAFRAGRGPASDRKEKLLRGRGDDDLRAREEPPELPTEQLPARCPGPGGPSHEGVPQQGMELLVHYWSRRPVSAARG